MSSGTEASNDLIIERVIELFKRSAEQPKSPSLDQRLVSANVFELLRREFSLAEIRSAIETCLRQTGDTHRADASTTGRQNRATDGCLRLARDVPALSLTSELVQELIYKIDSIAGLFLLRPQVERHLSEAQLIDALTLGIRTATADFALASCLAGVWHYYPLVKRRSDVPTLQRSLLALEREVRRLRTRDKECLGEVDAARRRLWSIRRARSELPRPAPLSYLAYREDGEAARHLIVRRDDQELAIAVTRCALDQRTLTIEYECFDPELLPENAPAVIELALLQDYSQGAYLPLVDQALFVDTRYEQTHRRRLARG